MRYALILMLLAMVGCAEDGEEAPLWELADNPPYDVFCREDVDSAEVASFDGVNNHLECHWDCVTYKGQPRRYVTLSFRKGEVIQEIDVPAGDGNCQR